MDNATPLVVDLGDALCRSSACDPSPALRAAIDCVAQRDVLLVVPLRLLLPAAGASESPLVLVADHLVAERPGAGLPGSASPAGAATGPVARFAGWAVDLGSRRLTGTHLPSRTLPLAEFRLLLAFLAEPRRVIPRAALVERALQDRDVRCARTLDVYVSRLRRHLRPQRRMPGPIGTVRSIGYVLNADVEFVEARH